MPENKKNILITGASGFIGGYVFRHLLKAGYNVVSFDICDNPKIRPELQIIGSIMDKKTIQNAVDKYDTVLHFAGFSNINKVKLNPLDCLNNNIIGTANILEALKNKGEGSIVLASSIYASSKKGHFYTTSKIAAESVCINYYDLFSIPISILRLGTVYGEHSRHEDVVSLFTKAAINNAPIYLHGNGQQPRRFIHGQDVAVAWEKIICRNNTGSKS